MGDAKRRKAEIEALKKTPREPRKRKLRKLSTAKTEQVAHFRNEAARRAANLSKHYRNSDEVTHAIKIGEIEPQFVQYIPVKIQTPTEIDSSRPPRQPHPFPLAVGAKGEDLAHYVIAMAQVAGGRGFRQPSAKAKNWKSTSLVEKLSIAFLGATANTFQRSERGEKKLKARIETGALILLDQLIARWPDRARQAKTDDQMLNWFVAKLEGAYVGDEADEFREWLRVAAKERLDGRDQKYLHSQARQSEEAA